MLLWKKQKGLEGWEKVLIAERRTESKYLMTQYSYEEIGRAFCHEAGEIRANDAEDAAQAAFAHSVAFRCFINKTACASKLLKSIGTNKPASTGENP